MTLNKKLIASAVGAGLAATSGLAQAWYDGYAFALIPYVVKDTNRTTVVTLIGDGQPASAGAALHLQYWTKSTTAANTAACEPSSVTMTLTDSDIVTFDTSGILGYPLFGDTTNPAPLGTSISYAGPRHGYLFVENMTGKDIKGAFWLELDLANGGAHGDNGSLWQTVDVDAQSSDDWAGGTVLMSYDGAPLGDEAFAPVNFWPSSVASTAFTVTPLGTDMLTVENNQLTVQVLNNSRVQGAYDRNENGVDGTVPQTVRCVGRLTAAQLMPGVVANAAWVAQGGWGHFVNLGDNANTTNDRDAVVYQIDTSSAAGSGKFMSNATRIVSWVGGD